MDYFNDPHYSAQTWWKLWPHNDHRVYATDRPLDSKSIYLVFHILFLSRPLTNSLTLGGCGSNFQSMILKLIIQNRSISTRCEIALTRIPQNLTDQSSGPGNGLFRPATSHYWSQCWPRCMFPYVVTRSVWAVSSLSSLNHTHKDRERNHRHKSPNPPCEDQFPVNTLINTLFSFSPSYVI